MKDDLIGRLEAATGPDRELDIALREAFGLPFVMEYYAEYSTEQTRNLSYVPRYTASIDAALTLVPEGCGWRIWAPSADSLQPHRATIWAARGRPMFSPFDVDAATPALALCIASLRAQP